MLKPLLIPLGRDIAMSATAAVPAPPAPGIG
jgi:hypothetical protein